MEKRSNARKICIVSHNGCGAITGGGGFVGGVEWQTSLLARWLGDRGHAVSFLTWDEGGGREVTVDGIRVLSVCKQDAGLPVVRFAHPKWTGLVSALRRADAEVYYQNCGECVTGQVALWCRRHKRAFVFSAANDTDCDAELPELKYWRDRALYRFGLKNAGRVVVQTRNQQTMMRRNFGVESEVIPMPCEGARPPWPARRSRPVSGRVLWLGRVCAQKRPDYLVDLAEAMPDVQFDLVGPHYTDECAKTALARAGRTDNIRIHGSLSRDRVAELFRNACCLVSTSDYEGFPNTFLEAWSHALPVVSRFDPDGLIADRELGLIAFDVRGLRDALVSLRASDALYARLSENALAYFRTTHAMESVQPRFEKVLLQAAGSMTGGGARKICLK